MLPDFDRDKSHLTETTVSKTLINRGIVVNTRRDEALRPDGKPCIREVVEHPGGVVILPLLDSGEIIMVEQWRYPLGKTLIEVPAGKLERGEDPFEAAQRELLEETGYKAHQWEPMHYIYTAPGFCDEKLYLYKASALELIHPHAQGDEDEFLDIHKLTPEEALMLVREGRITDSKTLCLLLHVFGLAPRERRLL